MKSGKTSSGFEFSFDEKNIDDMRWVEKLAMLETNPLLIGEVASQLLGKDQKERLYKFLEDEEGRVPVSKFSEAIEEIMTIASETDDNTKNS